MRALSVALAAAVALAPAYKAVAACDCPSEASPAVVPPAPGGVSHAAMSALGKREVVQLEGLGSQEAIRLAGNGSGTRHVALTPRQAWETAAVAPAGAAGGGESRTFLIAQAPTVAPAEESGVPLVIEAQTLDAMEGPDGYIEASGSVHASYEGIELHADYLRFNRNTMQGVAMGNVKVDRGVYHLRAQQFTFDLRRRQADAVDWQAWIERQGWFGGARLHLDETLVYSEDARVSPCLQEDPGYWLSGERLEWHPKSQYWNLRGQWVSVVVGGLPVFILPYFVASIGEEASKRRVQLPEARIDANVGYDGAQGIFVDSRAPYTIANTNLSGTIPVRVMSNRGVSVGLVQDFPTPVASGRFDANYTQYWPWLYNMGQVDPNRQGPHASLSFMRDWAGGAKTVTNLGYRVDVGKRSDTEYQVDPGGFPVHRMPEVITTWPAMSLGALSLYPSARAAYLHEVPTERTAGIMQGGLGFGLPNWRPNDFWETSFYGGANAAYYLGDRSQSVLFVGTGSSQRWFPWLSTSFRYESQPVYETGGGTPFAHDRAGAVDRVFINGDWRIYGPWSLGVGAFWARGYNDPFALESFNLGDLAFSFRYTVNCLGFGVTFRPPRGGQPFQYSFDYQLVSF